MSWCGGGLIRPTPGVECRTRAILGSPLWPGSWPPSPGLAPWAILIWMSSALTRYSAVTPKRPDATCLIAERMESALALGLERVGVSAAAAGRHLLERRAHGIAIGHRLETVGFLTALARVGTATDAVHGDGEVGMG